MKRLIILFSLLSGFLYGQTTVTLPPLRGGSLSTFNNSAMITDYAFIETDGVAGFYKLMSGDVTTPASDSVVVKTDNTRWKLLSNLSPTAVAWGAVTGKPTIYSSPSALKTALETLTGSARLDTSAIKNLAGITTESDPNVGSHIKAITTDDITAWNAKYGTGAAVVSSLSALTGTNRLPWTALKDVPAETDPNVGSHIKAITTTNITDWTASYRTGAAVVSALSSLSGSARLPASAIKDLPTVSDNSSIQKIETRVGGTLIGTRKSINLIAGSNVTVTGSDNSGSDRVDITLSATGGGGTGMAEPSTNGIAVRTSSGASAARSIVAPAAGITITNGSGVSGDPTLALADNLAGIEGLSTTGYVKRTGTGTFSAGTAIDLSGSEVTGTIAAARMPALTGDIVTTAGAVAASYNNVVPSSKGGAGSVTGLLKANGSGTVSAATSGTDYVVPSGSITGSAATLTTPRAIYGNNFDGSAALTGIIASTYGGTGNGFTKFSGATTSEKTYTLPNATATILTDNAAVTVAQGGTNASTAAGARTNLGLVIGTDVAAIASPTFTGTPAAPTASAGTSTTQLATTAFVTTADNLKANLASPTFTGTPLAPTASAGTNTTQISTTAFVKTAVDTRIPYQTITEIRAFVSGDVTSKTRVFVTDTTKQGPFYYDATDTTTPDNGGTVLVSTATGARFKRVYENYVNPKWFGAAGDGTTNDTQAFVNALALKKDLYVPKGNYVVNDTLDVYANIICEKDAKFKVANSYVGTLFRVRSLKGMYFKNLYVDATGTGIRVTGMKIEGLWNSTIDNPSFLANLADTGSNVDTSSVAIEIQTSQTTNTGFGVYAVTINNPYFIRGKYGIKTTQISADSIAQVAITHLTINDGWMSRHRKFSVFLNNAFNFKLNNNAFDDIISGTSAVKFNNSHQGTILVGEYNSGDLFNISSNCDYIHIDAPRAFPLSAITGTNYSMNSADKVRLNPTSVANYQTNIEGIYDANTPFRIQGNYFGSYFDLLSYHTTYGLTPRTNNPDATGSNMLGVNAGGGLVKVSARMMSQGTAAPTTGTWAVGDYRENTAPTAGGYFGWVCVTAGTPGTWKGYGAIQP